MKTSIASAPIIHAELVRAESLHAEAVPILRTTTRLADFVELTKPRISVLVLFTVAAGALLAPDALGKLNVLLHTLIGTGLVAAGASALNQLLERHSDALMRRTENRPLPAGRLTPAEVAWFGTGLGFVGLAYLAVAVRQPACVFIAAFTFVSYVFLYTPLKRKTTLNTLVGAVPGALPPVIGYAGMTGTLGAPAWMLFLVMFVWQVPHFLAIAWIYREDYARAGLKMLPVLDGSGAASARQMLLYTLTLLPVSLLPTLGRHAGLLYAFGAVGLGVMFLRAAVGFCGTHSVAKARKVLHASLIYLPVLLALLLLETWMMGRLF